MTIDRLILLFAGAMVLLGTALTAFVSIHFAWLTAFVGLNLAQSALTGFCPAALALRAMGVRKGAAFD